MNFDINMPIYIQLSEKIRNKIISGELKPGEKLESVRAYADMYEVNPNTVQRGLSELETMSLIYSKRTVGKFVTEDLALINKIKEEQIEAEIQEMLKKLRAQGYTNEEICNSLRKILKEEE